MLHRPIIPERLVHASLLLALACCLPLSLVIPPAWAWENGVIEDGDVLVLGIGLAWAFAAWVRGAAPRTALLGRCVVPIWAILIGRELSWGAVLLPPDHMSPEGPVFTSHHLWYRPFIVPVLAALFAWSAWSAWRCRLDRLLHGVLSRGHFPWLALLAVLIGALGSSMAEGHLPAGLPAAHSQRFEELAELVAYAALVAVQARVLQSCLAAEPADGAARTAPAA